MTFWQYIRYLLRRLLLPRSTKTMEWHMLRLLNRARKQHGLKALFMQQDLREVARKHSRDMAREDYFSHTNLKGKSPGDRLKMSRVTDAVSGENLAKIGGFPLPTQRAHIGLMNSPGHRANILNTSYNCVGIGVVKSEKKIYYFTQNFAKRELILNKKIPSKTTLRKGFILTGKSVRNIPEIIVETGIPHRETEQHLIKTKDGTFKKKILFKEKGFHKVKVFVPMGNRYTLCNHFEIKVTGGWWRFT